MKVNGAYQEYQKKMMEAKDILGRLHKGKQIIEESARKEELTKAFRAIRLYDELAQKLFYIQEECTLLHEHLSTGKSVVLKRTGEPVKIEDIFPEVNDEYEISEWELESLKILKQVFGEETKHIVEIRDTEQ